MSGLSSPRGGGPEFWNARFGDDDFLYGTKVNDFLREAEPLLPRQSRVLVPGDGEGRNGVWLASKGHAVTSVDWSTEGLRKTSLLAKQNSLEIETIEADLRTWEWPTGGFDAVVLIFLHMPEDTRRGFHRQALEALKDDGVLILEGFSKGQVSYQADGGSGGPRNMGMLFDENILRHDFEALTIDRLESVERTLSEGPGHSGKAAVTRLVGRRSISNPEGTAS